MRKIDPQLEFLIETDVEETLGLEDETELNRFGMEAIETKSKTKKPKVEVSVLIQYAGEPEALEKAGLTINTIAGDVVTGKIELSKLEKLSQLGDLERIESARPMHPELDLSVRDIRANLVHAGPPGRRGAGVIVGIVDTGCDFTHQCFRKSDGSSRIQMIWDQGLSRRRGERSPSGFSYGVEYSKAQIDRALRAANPFTSVRHRDPFRHGTHVAGISAGDGSIAGQRRPANTFVGVAPEADIIIVANRSNGGEGLGTSSNTLDAVNYIFRKAEELGKPCVINMSLGDNLGPHDGTSLLERGLDNLLGRKGRCFVKSAGNAGNARIHAGGRVATGRTTSVRFNQPSGDTSTNQIDMWYEGRDRFRISITDPAGNTVGPVNVGAVGNFSFPGGNRVRIDHRNNDAFNGDKRVFMTFSRGSASTIRSGNWQLRVRSISSRSGGRFNAWIQRGRVVPGFLSPHESRAMTISTPGNAREVITAANYSVRGFSSGSLAASSSRGPTRDGRRAPTIAAPGTSVFSASAESAGGDPYVSLSGTSMSAPHITGTIALMLQKNRDRTQAQIKQCLESSARSDANTGAVPNTAWGAGKLDAKAAVDCTPARLTLPISIPRFRCPPLSIPRPRCFTVSVPRTSCGIRSIPRTTCPPLTVPITACGIRTVPTTGCPPITVTPIRCPGPRTVARPNCVVPTVIGPGCGGGFQSVVRCPSVVDGCPSTPGGCNVLGPRINPGVINPGVINPGVFRPFNREDQLTQEEYDELAEEQYDDFDEQAQAYEQAAAYEELNAEYDDSVDSSDLPEEGFYEYDDGWFDE